jgi:long-chain acyl-CoA synthetase
MTKTNLWTLLEPSLKTYKNHPAWICRQKKGNQVITYQQIHQAVLSTAHKLRSLGIEPGDTVGITAPNGPQWSVAALASWKIGSVIAPIHIGNSDTDILNQIEAVKPKVMLLHDSKLNLSDTGIISLPISLEPDLESLEAEQSIPSPGDSGDVAVRIYTSGSTGTPKIVRLSHSNHASNMIAACKIQKFSSDDRFISLLPFSHAMGLTANLLLPFYCGCTIVAPRVLAASEVLATMEQEKISVLIAVPRLFRNIMLGLEKKFKNASPFLKAYIWALRKSPLSLRKYINSPIKHKLGGKIKVWVSGGSHLDHTICQYFHDLGLPLRQGYGLTETSPLACVQEEFDPAIQSVGKPIEDVEIKICVPDKDGRGEVCIRGPNVMLGYENPDHNNDAFDGQWFKTGDIGKLDDAGRLTLTGRSKRLIVTEAGKNVYPEELETTLERDSRIKEAGVFELEMKPVCVISSDEKKPEEAVRQALKIYNKTVSAHNQINRFAIVEELPRTPLGKLALQQLPEVFQRYEVK